jgi:hypothetical protein
VTVTRRKEGVLGLASPRSACAPTCDSSTRHTIAVGPQVDHDQFRLEYLGGSERAALDSILREFRLRGWRDDYDAAAAIVAALIRGGGCAPRRTVVRAVPSDFLTANGLERADLSKLFERLT